MQWEQPSDRVSQRILRTYLVSKCLTDGTATELELARTLHRSQACPVREKDWSLLLTALEKSSGPRSIRACFPFDPEGLTAPRPSPASLGRFGGRPGGMVIDGSSRDDGRQYE